MGRLMLTIYATKSPATKTLIYCYRAKIYSRIGKDEIIQAAQRNSQIPRAYLNLVFDALVTEVKNFVMTGHSIQLQGLGTIGSNIRSRGAMEAGDFDPLSNIRSVKFSFRPDSSIRRVIKSAELRVEKGAVESAGPAGV